MRTMGAGCGGFLSSSWRSTRSEEHTSELQSQSKLVCRLLLEKKKVKVFGRKLPAILRYYTLDAGDTYPKKEGIKNACSRLLAASTMKSRRDFAIVRLMNAYRQ